MKSELLSRKDGRNVDNFEWENASISFPGKFLYLEMDFLLRNWQERVRFEKGSDVWLFFPLTLAFSHRP